MGFKALPHMRPRPPVEIAQNVKDFWVTSLSTKLVTDVSKCAKIYIPKRHTSKKILGRHTTKGLGAPLHNPLPLGKPLTAPYHNRVNVRKNGADPNRLYLALWTTNYTNTPKIYTVTRNLSSHTTCRPTPAAAQRPLEAMRA